MSRPPSSWIPSSHSTGWSGYAPGCPTRSQKRPTRHHRRSGRTLTGWQQRSAARGTCTSRGCPTHVASSTPPYKAHDHPAREPNSTPIGAQSGGIGLTIPVAEWALRGGPPSHGGRLAVGAEGRKT